MRGIAYKLNTGGGLCGQGTVESTTEISTPWGVIKIAPDGEITIPEKCVVRVFAYKDKKPLKTGLEFKATTARIAPGEFKLQIIFPDRRSALEISWDLHSTQ